MIKICSNKCFFISWYNDCMKLYIPIKKQFKNEYVKCHMLLIKYNNNCYQEKEGFVDYKYVTPELNEFVKNKIKNIRKIGLCQVDSFYYKSEYKIDITSEFNMFEVLFCSVTSSIVDFFNFQIS
jgi:hypothetical protein